jgi:hypothetical protein
MTLQKGTKPGCMTLQNFGQPLLLVAASGCKCSGGMTLQKSTVRWLHEAANWHSALCGAPDPHDGTLFCYHLDTSAQSCGKCLNACATGQSCVSGACTSRCTNDQTDCTPTASEPTCIDLQTDVDNCGGCGMGCALSQGCVSGRCVGNFGVDAGDGDAGD